ncbi:hypothetical protein HF1_12290 [Mycoplasma haemofelis str. Langford 1]|uniref:Uncharacterized protein n=1 Tax=Mycoplasma haemofelis (strain Langford 1) TaxID=941640 RepID=E8ZJB6_MYCHL|nr:hypothetical protein [Mycoplasma haemofelis]CBY93237.1 hypothetical protein HF1_12290 [Mycoplasma haemofelis str. Langford 1]
MSIPLKFLAAAAGVGTVSTGAYFAISHDKGTNIKDRLEASGYSILNLDKGDSEEWEKIKEAYGKEDDEALRFNGVNKNDASTIVGIKTACSSLLASTSGDLEKARRWCVVPVTVSSRIGDNLALLSSQESQDTDLWNAKLEEHKKEASKFTKIPNVWDDQANSDELKLAALKKKCEEMAKLNTFDKDFESFVAYTKDWCTKPKKG